MSNALQFGVSRMFSVYSESARVEVEVFYDMASARAWLLEPGDADGT